MPEMKRKPCKICPFHHELEQKQTHHRAPADLSALIIIFTGLIIIFTSSSAISCKIKFFKTLSRAHTSLLPPCSIPTWLEDKISHGFRVFLFQGRIKNLKQPQSRGMNFPDTTTVSGRHLHKTSQLESRQKLSITGTPSPRKPKGGQKALLPPGTTATALNLPLRQPRLQDRNKLPPKPRWNDAQPEHPPPHSSMLVDGFHHSFGRARVIARCKRGKPRMHKNTHVFLCIADNLKYEGSQIERKRDRYSNTW